MENYKNINYFHKKDYLKNRILRRIRECGGWVNCHAHLDRAYTLNDDNIKYINEPLQKKWDLVDEIKKNSTVINIYDRMAYALEEQLEDGVTTICSFIDVDDVIQDKAIKAAQMIKNRFGDSTIRILFANQTLKGVLDKKAYLWFVEGSNFCDIIGSLPAKDGKYSDTHLDIVMETARRLDKRLHIHVDQFNTAHENETLDVVKKVKKHDMQGRVSLIHCISVACQKADLRSYIYTKLKKNDISVITCPLAWIDSNRNEKLTPTHNSITPVDEMLKHGIVIGLGTDNIQDFLLPYNNGSMWEELRLLATSMRITDLDSLSNISTTNGKKILGLYDNIGALQDKKTCYN